MPDKVELIKQEIERRYNCEKCYPLDREANVAAAVLQELLLFIDSLPEEPVSEDLGEEIENYIKDSLAIKFPTTDKKQIKADIRYIARHFAEWQKQKDKQLVGATQKISHQHGYDEGRVDMREEMMKDAVEGEVVYKIVSSIIAPTDIRYKVMSDKVYIPNVKLGDKVKIIIVNEEQQ